MFTRQIGIDLGTSYTRIYSPRKGIILNEPTVVALNMEDEQIVAIGSPALHMAGRTPGAVSTYRPLRDGVIADFRITETMLKHYFNQSLGRLRLRSPDVMVTVSAGATSTERKATLDVVKSAGGRGVYLIQSTVAAALGAAIPIAEPKGNMVIDIGGGTTEIAVISLSGIVAQSSVRVGGRAIDRAIIDYARRQYGLAIGEQTAEELKHQIGSTVKMEKKKVLSIEVHGRDIVGGLPKSASINSNELVPVITATLERMMLAIRRVIERTPPDLVSDILEQGIMLTGGGANLRQLDTLLTKTLNVPCVIAQDPTLACSRGTAIALTNLEDYKRSLLGLQ